MTRIDARIDADTFVARVDAHMLELLHQRSGVVVEAARGPIAAGGKRLRPLLVWAGRPIGAPGPDETASALDMCAVRAGAAVELIHTASLIHDDLLDGASVRRGVPTIDATHGRDVAVAAGDLLMSLAFETLVECRADAPAERAQRAVALLARASRTLAEGEALQARQLRDVTLQGDAYLERCAAKTGVLFGAALQLGAVLGGAAFGDVELLGTFGTEVGTAFQLADDLLDCGAPETEALLGKRPGADLRDGTITFPMIHAIAHAPRLAAELRVPVPAKRVETLLEEIRATGALEATRTAALQLHESAVQRLTGLDGQFDLSTLRAIARASVERLS